MGIQKVKEMSCLQKVNDHKYGHLYSAKKKKEKESFTPCSYFVSTVMD